MSRQEILSRIKAALKDTAKTGGGAPSTEANMALDISWEYGRPTTMTDSAELFIERVCDYKAMVEKVSDATKIPALVARFLVAVNATSCVVPSGIDKDWVSLAQTNGIEILVDDPPLPKETINNTSAVLTAAAVAMAQTGTIALNHKSDQGRRMISLLPDTHICVVHTEQIATDVPEAMLRLESSIREGQPITWVSGPSATSDIELVRVEGVHGPRNLYVIVVDGSADRKM